MRRIRLGFKGLKHLVALIVVLTLALIPSGVFAATTAGITIDATPTFISISLNQTAFNFGNVTAGVNKNTATGWCGVTDASSVAVNATIACNSTWEGGANDWTWGAAGNDTSRIKASNGTAAYNVVIAELYTEYELNKSAVAGTAWKFELQLEAPSAFTYGNAQSCQIRITATAA